VNVRGSLQAHTSIRIVTLPYNSGNAVRPYWKYCLMNPFALQACKGANFQQALSSSHRYDELGGIYIHESIIRAGNGTRYIGVAPGTDSIQCQAGRRI
jgi:hypothetical protein